MTSFDGAVFRLAVVKNWQERKSWAGGAYGQLDEHAPQAYDKGRWQYGYLSWRPATI